MLQNDSHLNCLCVMARLIEALAIYGLIYTTGAVNHHLQQLDTNFIAQCSM